MTEDTRDDDTFARLMRQAIFNSPMDSPIRDLIRDRNNEPRFNLRTDNRVGHTHTIAVDPARGEDQTEIQEFMGIPVRLQHGELFTSNRMVDADARILEEGTMVARGLSELSTQTVDEFMDRRSETYQAGYLSVVNGVDSDNTHFRHFSTKESMRRWEAGRDQALKEKQERQELAFEEVSRFNIWPRSLKI